MKEKIKNERESRSMGREGGSQGEDGVADCRGQKAMKQAMVQESELAPVDKSLYAVCQFG